MTMDPLSEAPARSGPSESGPSESETVELATMRLEYETAGLSPDDLAADPVAQFNRWMADAVRGGVFEPNAMVVSTVDGDGQPWSRHLLLKGATTAGFEFYTNYHSDKSRQLTLNAKAAATFGWLELHRQVNLAGAVERVADADSDDYWSLRLRGSQLGAWASDQSGELPDREALLQRYRDVEERFPEGQDVPRPEHWGGWRLVPHTVEFWQGRVNRLHDRLRYRRQPDGSWAITRLSP